MENREGTSARYERQKKPRDAALVSWQWAMMTMMMMTMMSEGEEQECLHKQF